MAGAVLAATIASADIYRWTDEEGVVHFTNSTEGIPDEARPRVESFVRERPRPPFEEATTEPDREGEELPPPRLVEVSDDSSSFDERLARAFAEGVDAGAAERPAPVVEVHSSPVVQNVFVESREPEPRWIVGGFVPTFPRVPHRLPPAPPARREPVNPAPFVTGPAGPPPIGAAGPPPLRIR